MLRTFAEWKILLKAERKKAWTLAGLVGVMAILGARQMVPMLRPSSAQAQSGVSMSDALVGGLLDAESGPVTGRGSVVRVTRPGPVQRDLFRFDPLYFPKPPETAPPDLVGQKSVESEVDKTIPEVAESPEARTGRVRGEAGVLRIRSVMFGTNPMAVIEVPEGKSRATRFVRPGDVVLGFTVTEIGAGVVMLEKDGVDVELTPER